MQSTAAKRYAQALFSLAMEKKLELEPQLSALAALWKHEPLLSQALANPRMSLTQKRAIINQLGQELQINQFVLNTLNLMVDKGRIAELLAFVAKYRALDDQERGRIRALCRTASDLDASQAELLKSKLASLTGARIVDLEVQTDPGLLAGFVVNIGGKIIDGSLKGRLERMGRKLAQGS